MNSLNTLLMSVLIFLSGIVSAQTVSNVAGTPGVLGAVNGPASSATFNNPHSVTVDRTGNIFVADRFGHRIRKITPAGVVSTFAGSGSPGATDGTGTAASFNEPWAVACDTLGNVYVADTKNYKIRKISSGGTVSTFAGTGTFGVTNGLTNVAQFGFPAGLAVSNDGSLIYVVDRMTNTIRKIENDSVITFAGAVFSPGSNDGQGLTARFDHPYGIALDANGNVLVADEFNNKIRMINPSGMVSTIAGSGAQGSNNGSANTASFNSPWGVCVDNTGAILVGDANNFTVRKIYQGMVSVYAGQDGVPGMMNGPALQSSFNGVSSLWYHPVDNSLYVTDPYSHLVRKIAPESITLTTSTGAISFCSGSPVTLVASPSNLSNYVFMDGVTVIGTSANGTLTLSSLPQGSYNITCSATNTQGITISSNLLSVQITSSLQVSIAVSGNTTICQGDSVTLTASPAGIYQWSTGANTASVVVLNAGNYTVIVTNAQGCSGQSAPVEILTLQPPAANVTASVSGPACVGDSVMLTSGAANSYLWSNGATSQSIYVTGPGNYTVQVSNGSGCSAISVPVAVSFHVQNTSSISPSGNILLVQGSTVVLEANSGSAYLWSNGQTTQSISVSAPGTYTVTVSDGNGCLSTPASVQVSYINSSNIITVSGSSAFCDGDSVLLTSVFTTGNQWFFNGGIISGAVQQDYYASLDGYYHVVHSPTSGPSVTSDSVNVTVYQRPGMASFTPDSVCRGEQATLTLLPQQGISFSWYDVANGGASIGNGLSFITPALQSTTNFYVQSTNGYGCESEQRTPVPAVLYPVPTAEIINTMPTLINGSYEIYFTVLGSQGQTYYWDFGDPSSPDNTATTDNPYHAYSQPGEYTVTLEVTNQYGCFDVFTKNLSVKLPNNLFIPTGFTPNSDGNNDLFRVRGHNILFTDMSIFNQWGQRIWHSPTEKTGWDGTANGQTVPVGSYAYVIEVHYDDGKKEMHRGNINLIR